jgi:hypothetical protein
MWVATVNFHPARTFMGDVGAMTLGYILGVSAIIGGAKLATALLVMGVPLIDGVIGAQNTEQAMERSGGKQGNRGSIAAATAIDMASVLKKLRDGSP